MAPPKGRRYNQAVIATLLLAAGAGARLGGDKLLQDLAGEPLLRRAARSAVDADLGPVLVVAPPGDGAAPLVAAVAGLTRCEVVESPAAALGMNASLAAGVRAVPGDAEAAIVALADMPLVDASHLRALAARWRERGGAAPVVGSRYGGVAAPPVLFARALLPELGSGPPGDGRGRELLRRHAGAAAWVDLPAEALLDVDSAEDLERARRRAGGRSP